MLQPQKVKVTFVMNQYRIKMIHIITNITN